jgi:hypothetical protein
MSISTKVILKKLLQIPLISGRQKSSSSDDDQHFIIINADDRQSDKSISDEGQTEDILQLKMKNPKLAPVPKNKLTIQEQEQLLKEFNLANHMLYNFKEILRQKGFDVSSYFVSIQNGRVSYHIPNIEHYHLFMATKNQFTKNLNIRDCEPVNRNRMKP